MATFGYGRVSTKEQTTENQRIEIESAGYKLDYWHADDGVSGAVFASQRPQFKELLGKIRFGEYPRLDNPSELIGRVADNFLSQIDQFGAQVG